MKRKKDGLPKVETEISIGQLISDSRKEVHIEDMADYYDVFFAIEHTTMLYWHDNSKLKDQDVLDALNRLLRDLDDTEEGTLASEISKGLRAILISRQEDILRDYTFGEIRSCVLFLKKIVKSHHSPDGIGYLKWTKAFFEGRLPESPDEIADYILRNET